MLSLLVFVFCSPILDVASLTVEEDLPSTGPPHIQSAPINAAEWGWVRWRNIPPEDVDTCHREKSKHHVAEDLDMRKMMGRWFVGFAYYRLHSRLRPSRLHLGKITCITYEFDRLMLAHHTTTFDVTITYRPEGDKLRREYGIMRSSVVRQAMLMHFTSHYDYQSGQKFWIYKVGPEVKDSFGRPQYEYAIVGGCGSVDMVLVRSPYAFRENYKEEILHWMEVNGHDVTHSIQPAYSGCYFESITQTFGASDPESDETATVATRLSFESEPDRNQSCDSNVTNSTLAEGFDTRKMMGRWFEGLTTLPSDNRSCVVSEFKRLQFIGSNGTIDYISFEMRKTYREPGFPLRKDDYPTYIATAYSEIPKFGTQFWVYKVGPEVRDTFGRVQYEYLIVSNCEKSFVKVLIRTPATFEDRHKKSVMAWIEENDFSIEENALVLQDYSSCHYADSIILPFGDD